MKKFALVLFILLDLGVIGGSAYFLYTHFEQSAANNMPPPAVASRSCR